MRDVTGCLDGSDPTGVTRDQELEALKRELAQVKKERDCLREAAAFHLIGFLAVDAAYHGDSDGARTWNEVAQRFIPDAYMAVELHT